MKGIIAQILGRKGSEPLPAVEEEKPFGILHPNGTRVFLSRLHDDGSIEMNTSEGVLRFPSVAISEKYLGDTGEVQEDAAPSP